MDIFKFFKKKKQDTTKHENNFSENYDFFYGFKSGVKRCRVPHDPFKPYTSYWAEIKKAYKKIGKKFEEYKEYDGVEGVKDWVKSVDIFFEREVFSKGIEGKYISDSIPVVEDPGYLGEDYFFARYLFRELTEDEYVEAQEKYQEWIRYNHNRLKRDIYEIYTKLLRRAANFYKREKEWGLAHETYERIREYGFEGLNDIKFRLKSKKELEK